MAGIVALAITVAGGALHGQLTGRWEPTAALEPLAERLQSLPDAVGAWRLKESKQLPTGIVTELQCTGYISRVYVHSHTGAEVAVAVLAGPAGPIAVHTPELCYSSRDYTPIRSRERVSIGQHELWTLFLRAANDVDQLRVVYGWSDGQRWAAPESARLAFGGNDYLYKLQVASYDTIQALHTEDVCLTFTEEFIKALQPYLQPPDDKS